MICPIVGYKNNVVNSLMIWDAEPIMSSSWIPLTGAITAKRWSRRTWRRNLVEVLYPNDNHIQGKELRLKQQYFFVSASLQRAVARYKKYHPDIHKLYEKVTIQMNDTHPTVAVAELMRILMDEGGPWLG